MTELHFPTPLLANETVLLRPWREADISLEQGRAATGYWLAPQARGREVASTAVRLLAQWGFTELGLARVELTCGPDISCRVLVVMGAPTCSRGRCVRSCA